MSENINFTEKNNPLLLKVALSSLTGNAEKYKAGIFATQFDNLKAEVHSLAS
jgi:hypothetical protein